MHNIVNPQEFRANICTKLQYIIDDEVLSINLEKGVFNYSLKEGTIKKALVLFTLSHLPPALTHDGATFLETLSNLFLTINIVIS